MKQYEHFINGNWVTPTEGHYFDSIDPAHGTVWAKFPRGNEADIDLAVTAAHQAFVDSPWSHLSKEERADSLNELADLLEQHWTELVESEIRDNGKRITEVNAQFAGLHTWYRYFANQVLSIDTLPLENQIPGVTSAAHFVPFGVVGVITPWNSPLMILAWKIAPALAAGNTVVIKPSEFASASTFDFARLVSKSSIPDGVINVVGGYGHEAGEPLVKHPDVRKVTFTGSDNGGRKVAIAAAANIIPTTLELGGKSPQLLFADADLDNAVNGIISGIFLSNGQTCVAGSRLIVEEPIYEHVVSRITERASRLRAGDPMQPETQIAPLANQPHLNKVLEMIDEAKSQGATCVFGGKQIFPDDRPNGFYIEPTIFTGVTPEMNLWHEEVFGPVLSICSFKDTREAVRLANDSNYGLAAGIWTSNSQLSEELAAQINAGTIYINHYRSVDPGSPIGGFKCSGYGKELGPDAVKDFLQAKSVWTGNAPCPNPFPDVT